MTTLARPLSQLTPDALYVYSNRENNIIVYLRSMKKSLAYHWISTVFMETLRSVAFSDLSFVWTNTSDSKVFCPGGVAIWKSLMLWKYKRLRCVFGSPEFRSEIHARPGPTKRSDSGSELQFMRWHRPWNECCPTVTVIAFRFIVSHDEVRTTVPRTDWL
jgi:hypothetical protein